MGATAEALQACRERLAAACAASGRASGCADLLAVSKTFPAERMREAWLAGQRRFGESYVQEALEKQRLLADLDIEWHFIGPIQSNKTRPVAEHFAWAHAVDREKIARRLSEQRPASLPPLNLCIQVNVSGEASKHGAPPGEALALARQVAALPGVRLRGFMAIPEPTPDEVLRRTRFDEIARLLREARAQGVTSHGLPLDTLSMGMTADLEDAIQAGATLVRVGSGIFGARDYSERIHP